MHPKQELKAHKINEKQFITGFVKNWKEGNKNFDFLLLGCKLAAETVESSYPFTHNTGSFSIPFNKQS
jgi:hypothetical protein